MQILADNVRNNLLVSQIKKYVVDVERYKLLLSTLSIQSILAQIVCADCCKEKAFVRYLGKYVNVCKLCIENFQQRDGQKFGYVPPKRELFIDVTTCPNCKCALKEKKICEGCGKVLLLPFVFDNNLEVIMTLQVFCRDCRNMKVFLKYIERDGEVCESCFKKSKKRDEQHSEGWHYLSEIAVAVSRSSSYRVSHSTNITYHYAGSS